MPARQAFVPEIIPERLIFTAMALNTTGWNLSRIIGPAVAGLLIAWLAGGNKTSAYGVGIVYLVIASLYLFSALTVLKVDRPGKAERNRDGDSLSDMQEGLRYVIAHPQVFALIVLSILPFLFGMPLNTLLPAFNQDVLQGHADDLGYLISAMGGGAIIGSLLMAAMGDLRKKGFWLIVSCLGWGAVTAAFGAFDMQFIALALIALIGMLSSWNMSLNRGMLQMAVEGHMRGRIMSIDMMSHGLMPLGVFPISLVAEYHGVGAALVVSGCALMVITLLVTFFLPSVRRTLWAD